MSNDKNIKVLSSFIFNTEVLRAEELDGERYLHGIASSTSIDSYKTIFNEKCQEYFVEQCANNIIPIDIEHQVNFLFRVGKVVEAFTVKEESGKVLFHIKIQLKKNRTADDVWEAITNPDPDFADVTNFGLSIKGLVEEAHHESIGGEIIKVFDRVKLTYITITQKPSNADTFLEAIERSIETPDFQELTTVLNNDDNKEVMRMRDINDMLKVSEVLANINKIVAEMVEQINNVQSANLTTENVLEIVKMFAEKYEDKIEWECCKGLYSAVNDTDSNESDVERDNNEVNEDLVTRSEVETALDSYKSNLIETLNNKLSEIKNSNNIDEEVNKNDEREQASSTASSEEPNSTSDSESESTSGSSESTISQQEVERSNSVMGVEVKTETIDFEQIARSIAESIVKEKVDLIERSYKEEAVKLTETISKLESDLEVLRNQPSTIPVNIVPQIGNLVQRNNFDDLSDRVKSKDMSVSKSAIDEVMKSFYGKQ